MAREACRIPGCYHAAEERAPGFFKCYAGHVYKADNLPRVPWTPPESEAASEPSLFDEAPDPPTGPKAESYTPEDGELERYSRWRETEEGQSFWRALVRAADAALAADEKRFSTRTFLANYRAAHKVRINDHFSPYMADELVAKDPFLLDLVERRARRKT